LPLQTGNELAVNFVQVLQQKREGLARRFLRRQHFDHAIADQEMVSMAVNGRIRDEVVKVRIVRESCGIYNSRVVVK
jgi:hypothetical protein